MDTKTRIHKASKANKALHDLSRNVQFYQIPVKEISIILVEAGFLCGLQGIFCGREGQAHFKLEDHFWFSLVWSRTDSGRFEIGAHVYFL